MGNFKSRRLIFTGCALVLSASMVLAQGVDAPHEPETPASADGSLGRLAEEYPERILPLVQKHCMKCHSAEEKKGDL
ncbi:MAG: hypothetical protein VB835_05075, partial [Pirellulales bacterium]